MILRRVFPSPGEPIDITVEDARERLRELYAVPEPAWLRLNLISSVDGNAVGSDGTSESLTNRADRAILAAIRSLADVILVGAASVRAEGYHLPSASTLAILTMSGDLAGHRMGGDDEAARVLVLCPAEAREAVLASFGGREPQIVEIDDVEGRLPAVDVIRALHDRGLRRIVCEGGPSVAAQLLDAGVVDELCLSTGPVVAGAGLPLLGRVAEHRLTLAQLLVDDASGVYARWRCAPDDAQDPPATR